MINGSQPCISAITEIELLCWKTAIDKYLEILRNFIRDALVIELERPIKLKAAEIRKMNNVKLPDAIIAATAIVYDLTLITRNIRDFQNVPVLKLLNPFESKDFQF